jgi:hypothetical protein
MTAKITTRLACSCLPHCCSHLNDRCLGVWCSASFRTPFANFRQPLAPSRVSLLRAQTCSTTKLGCCATKYHPNLLPSAQVRIMDTDMEIDPEIAAMMGFGSFGGNKKRKFGADEAFTDAQPAKTQEPQQVVSSANAVPVAEARSRPANAPVAGKFTWQNIPSDHY